MKRIIFTALLSIVAVAGCQKATTKPATMQKPAMQPTSHMATESTSSPAHTTLKPPTPAPTMTPTPTKTETPSQTTQSSNDVKPQPATTADHGTASAGQASTANSPTKTPAPQENK